MGVLDPLLTMQDNINQTAWRTRGALRWYANLRDWTDPGEAAAIAYVSEAVQGKSLLDVGIGAGRTVPILKLLSADYTGIDYTPELVTICRRKHPGAKVHLMDARDLSAFEDESFAFVMFSFNGIDSVDNDGRLMILSEFARVLKPGGVALFSTHNLHGPSYKETLLHALQVPWSYNPVKLARNCVQTILRFPAAVANYRRHLPLGREYGGYATRVCAAHNFGILIQYIDMATQRQQCANVGLFTEAIFGSNSGRQIYKNTDITKERYFHFIVRKP